MLSRVKKIIFSRAAFCVIGVLLQLTYLALLFWTLGTMFSYSYLIFVVIGFIVALFIINGRSNPSYKLIWTFVVLSFPIFGCMIYWFYGNRRSRSSSLLPTYIRAALSGSMAGEAYSGTVSRTAKYLSRVCGFPLYSSTETEYYKTGETAFPYILQELQKAEKFIFLQYFIIEDGVMWRAILDVLTEKAKSGVEVRVMYDDMGCLLTLPRNYFITIRNMGLKCCCFGRVKPIWSPKVNNRDHRKILVIDGKCGFTGGINLADEYINLYEKHGYWKDSVIRIKGNAVNSMTAMFLSAWDYVNDEQCDPQKYISETVETADTGGTAIPFMSSPLCREAVAESVYISLISAARRYIYITTPYLILDNEMKSALILAAKSGVDVRIITPHIPDKRVVFEVTRANYQELVKNGVRIYEFTDGFIHAKNLVIDDIITVVGSVNLDFRSLYLHYECGVVNEDVELADKVREDFIDTLLRCEEITAEMCRSKSLIKRMVQSVLRFFSPMM